MKRTLELVCVMLLASCVCVARNEVQLVITSNLEAVKDAAIFVLKEAGYSVSEQGETSVLFTKDLYSTPYLPSPPNCGSTPPVLYLTLNLSKTEHGTLASISAIVEHSAVQWPMGQETLEWITPPSSNCDVVREPPVFMRNGKLLTAMLKDIGSRSAKVQRESATPRVAPAWQ